MAASSSSQDQAIAIVSTGCFHKALWIPHTPDHPQLRVTYATTTNFDSVSLPVILFISPMFGLRWSALHFDKLARECGVRIICVDRPGFGGSMLVHLNLRMRVWLETIPILLEKVQVKHVNIVTHSAGTMYTLNTLCKLRSILDPKAPYVAFLAPYVPFVHSGATLPSVASKLPVAMIDSLSGISTFVNNKIRPSASWSGGIISAAAQFAFPPSTDVPTAEPSSSTTPLERYGYDKDTAETIEKLSFKYQFQESTKGANEEAKLCLGKCNEDDWGEAADYLCCIRTIAVNESSTSRGSDVARLKVEAFFAGSDVMIGKRGQQFFEQCWQRQEVAGEVDFKTSAFPEADHDSVLVDHKKGALKVVFERIAALSRNSG
ncbi:hypothetical protein B9Z65_4992 [Elsinoe australis]|uniref:AB hydrolase-1 domain-containing protein n=1 Tax=Elsinoe australis TaxID=40998 RepID=A0A2P7ZCS7_9PEZI|nr:hypothetical protein B9Z65_4992 [Elsinoe australis]